MSRALRFAPLAALILLVASLVWRLSTPPDSNVKSRMVGKPVPDLLLPAAIPGQPPLPLRRGGCRPVVVNFFASWCVPCIAEAQRLAELRRQGVRFVGIAVRDRPEDVAAFLVRHGNPYEQLGADPQSKVQMAFGSSGVPETFVVDRSCTIRHQHIGAIEEADVPVIRAQWDQLGQ